MTDYSKMTDEQINEAVLIARGGEHGWNTEEFGDKEKCVTTTGRYSIYNRHPDYTHSWELCGELLEEMSDSANVVVMLTNGKDWEDGDRWACDLFIDGTTNLNPYLYTTPLRSICVGFLVWREQK